MRCILEVRVFGQETGLVQWICEQLRLAWQTEATDLHFEPVGAAYGMRLRCRIAGTLTDQVQVPAPFEEKVLSGLKLMSNLDISECRLPQEGQFSYQVSPSQVVSVRVSILPLKRGEKAVLRLILSPGHEGECSETFAPLPNKILQAFQKALSVPHGLILVIGPTGSGKTSTLYSGLLQLSPQEQNICTVEDPVERVLEGVNQVEINPRIGLTFSRVLRAILRQDPDVLMIGEVRDTETAAAAITAAQSGHLVLSSLHAQTLFHVPDRLQRLGIPKSELRSVLALIIAQSWQTVEAHHSVLRGLHYQALPCSQQTAPLFSSGLSPQRLEEILTPQVLTQRGKTLRHPEGPKGHGV